MIDKGPEDYSFVTYLWILGIAIYGGIVSYMEKLRRGKKLRIRELLVELVASGFAGVITFYICQGLGLSTLVSAALVGMAGHSSSKVITLLDGTLARVLKGVR